MASILRVLGLKGLFISWCHINLIPCHGRRGGGSAVRLTSALLCRLWDFAIDQQKRLRARSLVSACTQNRRTTFCPTGFSGSDTAPDMVLIGITPITNGWDTTCIGFKGSIYIPMSYQCYDRPPTCPQKRHLRGPALGRKGVIPH